MEYEEGKALTLKPKDFIPVIGAFLYQKRNWENAIERGYPCPTPYKGYISTIVPLGIINVLTGVLIFKGLESLLNQAF